MAQRVTNHVRRACACSRLPAPRSRSRPHGEPLVERCARLHDRTMVESRERPVLEALAGRAAIGDKRVGSGRWHDGVREALRDQQRCRDWVIRDILCEPAASDALVFVAKGRPRKRLSAPRSAVDLPLERIRTGLRSGVRLQAPRGATPPRSSRLGRMRL